MQHGPAVGPLFFSNRSASTCNHRL